MNKNSCFFTGHRRILPEHNTSVVLWLEGTVRKLIESGVSQFYAGGALGFDTLAAQTVIRLKKEYPYIRLILLLPCQNQSDRWSPADIDCYEQIKKLADEVIYLSQFYHSGCMYRRNKALVDSGGVCVCYLFRNTGGTAYTVQYAKEKGRQIICFSK